MVLLKGSVPISFGRSTSEPAAYGELVAMGGINKPVKRQLIATLAQSWRPGFQSQRPDFFLKRDIGDHSFGCSSSIYRAMLSHEAVECERVSETKTMPCLNISANVSLEGVDTSSILSEATSTVAKIISKPEAYVMIVLKGSVPIAFGGTEQPAAYGELVSIGGLNPDVNKKLSAAIAAILETKLSVPKSRFFLKFYDTKASHPTFSSPSKSRICTVFACFTPELDHVNKVPTLDGMGPPSKARVTIGAAVHVDWRYIIQIQNPPVKRVEIENSRVISFHPAFDGERVKTKQEEPPHPLPSFPYKPKKPPKSLKTKIHNIRSEIRSDPPTRNVEPNPPPILPVSTTSTTTAGSVQSQAPIATPAFRAFLTHIAENLRNGLSQRRPWTELFDRSAFAKPESLSEATGRVRKNYSYFRVNYLATVALIVAVSLFTHPFSLLVLLGLLAGWLFLYLFRPSDQPLVIFGRTFSDTQTLWGLIAFSIFVVFLTSVGSLLISALLVGAAVVFAHGAFRVPEDLFLDEQEPTASTGFLSFLNGAASNVAAATAPAVIAARVDLIYLLPIVVGSRSR
ncbi:prenylated RAB acceptor 1.B4 [Prunus dulcis]|uniref:Prenylated RAB acceptor 1.B4 n=1 Tax=Prunus dulcis TaxID=3755 RepID=A0A4Y1RPQ9_PRUDU|nr:prenylated RAB acceptor 1.B4 [Prunus dulcis]